jgi:hypothetical protein
MSKITPKNLQYDSTLPPFLARLQANNNSRDGRHEFNVARPKKARNAEEVAEDEPVYFDEGTGETLTKSEWEKKDKADAEEERESGANVEGKDGREKDGVDGGKEVKEKVTAIGASKKRKVGKIIGGEEEDGKGNSVVEKETPKPTEKKLEKVKGAKKGKKIKLSFGDDE